MAAKAVKRGEARANRSCAHCGTNHAQARKHIQGALLFDQVQGCGASGGKAEGGVR